MINLFGFTRLSNPIHSKTCRADPKQCIDKYVYSF